ncbi:hypothetical protein EON62_05175, partial [archaeon]
MEVETPSSAAVPSGAGAAAAGSGSRSDWLRHLALVPLLKMFNTADATVLRAVCKEQRDVVAKHDWCDRKTRIKFPKLWRKCFPHATGANVSNNLQLKDADFEHLKGVQMLDMSFCEQSTITDAAFVHLGGLTLLKMSGCKQASITNNAFAHLKSVRFLNISNCTQLGDAAFRHFKDLEVLDFSGCNQDRITNAAFANLTGVKALYMSY